MRRTLLWSKKLPPQASLCLSKLLGHLAHRYARGMISGSGSTLFEELGLYYIGPVDGHNLDDLVAVLSGENWGSSMHARSHLCIFIHDAA